MFGFSNHYEIIDSYPVDDDPTIKWHFLDPVQDMRPYVILGKNTKEFRFFMRVSCPRNVFTDQINRIDTIYYNVVSFSGYRKTNYKYPAMLEKFEDSVSGSPDLTCDNHVMIRIAETEIYSYEDLRKKLCPRCKQQLDMRAKICWNCKFDFSVWGGRLSGSYVDERRKDELMLQEYDLMMNAKNFAEAEFEREYAEMAVNRFLEEDEKEKKAEYIRKLEEKYFDIAMQDREIVKRNYDPDGPGFEVNIDTGERRFLDEPWRYYPQIK